MALILHLETATTVCSVALSRDEKLCGFYEENQDYRHASILNSFILKCLEEGGAVLKDVDAVAVSSGPGSYTGLRIGASAAKGICYALEIPLISVNTLQAMAFHLIQKQEVQPGHLLCPMIDARRMEVYNAIFDHKGNFVRPTRAEIITAGAFNSYLDQGPVIFFGDGMAKCRHLIAGSNAVFNDNINPSALGMIPLAEKSYNSGNFADLAYFSPFYLKDFLDPRQPPIT